jgi:hypothetical protein
LGGRLSLGQALCARGQALVGFLKDFSVTFFQYGQVLGRNKVVEIGISTRDE